MASWALGGRSLPVFDVVPIKEVTPVVKKAHTPPTMSEWLSVAGVAKMFGVGTRSIYKAVQSGEMRACPINDRGDLRIAPEWAREWAERRADDLMRQAEALRGNKEPRG